VTAALTVPNPWTNIALGDYEKHMSDPRVGQAQMLADQLKLGLAQHRPNSILIVGCAGGNGFDSIEKSVQRVVGIDINAAYVEQARSRFQGRFKTLELLSADIENEWPGFEPVDFAFAALIFEYVDPATLWKHLAGSVTSNGIVVSILQLASVSGPVSDTAIASIAALRSVMRLVLPSENVTVAEAAGFTLKRAETALLPSGKSFASQVFRRRRQGSG
jgi:protein-L-isoaspartate O-methyltransferase